MEASVFCHSAYPSPPWPPTNIMCEIGANANGNEMFHSGGAATYTAIATNCQQNTEVNARETEPFD